MVTYRPHDFGEDYPVYDDVTRDEARRRTISEEVENQLGAQVDTRFDLYCRQYDEQLAEIREEVEELKEQVSALTDENSRLSNEKSSLIDTVKILVKERA